jgi:cytochrome P450
MDHMAAGIDTTGDALCFLMYQLSLPESWHQQEKLAREFRENEGKTLDELGGTIVSAQAWSVHRLNDDIYENGDSFIPERWLDDEKSLEMNRFFFAFGLGSRGCTGRQ